MSLSASELQRCDREVPPAARLDLAPVSFFDRSVTGPPIGWIAASYGLALAVNAGFALFFAALLMLPTKAPPVEVEIPVEIVSGIPGGGGAPGSTGGSGSAGSGPQSPQAGPQAPDAKVPGPLPTPPKPAPADPLLVKPPPEAAPAAVQPQPTKPNDVAVDPPQPKPIPTPPPPEAPKVLTTADRTVSDAAPRQAEAAPDPAPQAATQPADRAPPPVDPLAAALPTNLDTLPMTFRAVLSGAGAAQQSQQYKGLVFGKLGRSREIAERAQALHLRGRVIVAFTIDDAGKVVSIGVLQSSGMPAVDATALDMVRAAAPFPPPPPGAQRDFTPALIIGE